MPTSDEPPLPQTLREALVGAHRHRRRAALRHLLMAPIDWLLDWLLAMLVDSDRPLDSQQEFRKITVYFVRLALAVPREQAGLVQDQVAYTARIRAEIESALPNLPRDHQDLWLYASTSSRAVPSRDLLTRLLGCGYTEADWLGIDPERFYGRDECLGYLKDAAAQHPGKTLIILTHEPVISKMIGRSVRVENGGVVRHVFTLPVSTD